MHRTSTLVAMSIVTIIVMSLLATAIVKVLPRRMVGEEAEP
jgi:hypothetical protein